MWKRKCVRIEFTIKEGYRFSGSCSASVNIDKYGELIDSCYCEDIEDLEDVELLEAIDEEDECTLNEDNITEEDIYEVKGIYLY
jgi:hypothetical protein